MLHVPFGQQIQRGEEKGNVHAVVLREADHRHLKQRRAEGAGCSARVRFVDSKKK